jgi:Alr-MurF fusion protein
MIFFSQLGGLTGGKTLLTYKDEKIEAIAIDSRKAAPQPGTLFFAIRGERHDGHEYIPALYQIGIRQFVVEDSTFRTEQFPEANILLVQSAVDALQKVAANHRSKFSFPVIGITGSNGKTIIKEWLFQMLSNSQIIVKNPGSYNSQVGVPLSVWQMQSHHQLGIFEAGISKLGEMENLERIIQPTIGIFTNIGSAHDEGFHSQAEKISEKLKLFKNSKIVIYCADQESVRKIFSETGIRAFSWGTQESNDVVVSTHGQTCYITFKQQEHIVQLPFSDKASVENCLHCIAVMLYMGYTFKAIQRGINSLRSVPMRMEMKEGINQSYIIDDTYNNDLGGLELSLQFLAHQNQKRKKRLILSDILESGLSEKGLIDQILNVLKRFPLQNFVGIGPILSKHREMFFEGSEFYRSTDEFLTQFDYRSIYEEVILVKGARTFAFEKIVIRLQRKVHGTVLEIDLGALVHNLNFFRSRLNIGTRIMVMVKAFAYGSSSPEVANLLQYHKVDYLGVAYVDEGVDLRKNNITIPTMVMNPSEDSFDSLIAYNLEPEIYNFKIFRALLLYLRGRACTIHLKLDTGMHRLGFEQRDINEVVQLLKQNPNIRVASIFSHLAGADERSHDEFSNSQAALFKNYADTISSALPNRPLYHILNSPGILRLPALQFDMVRLGIGLYGVDPTEENFNELRPVASLKTIISQIKIVPKGDSIGYGRKGTAEKEMRLATIAIGYADGFSRALSKGVGEVSIHGHKAPVVGNVCMDMTMVDITDIECEEGDEVIVFGRELPIQSIATKIHTIPYEILTNVSERVKRVFVSDGI